MNWIEIVFFGLISGLSEFLPISSGGHQRLMLYLFGKTQVDPLCHLVLSLGTLLAVTTGCKTLLRRLMVERAVAHSKGRHRVFDSRHYDYRIVKTAMVPLALVYTLFALLSIPVTLPGLALAFIISGIVLFVTENMRHGNKESNRMSALDSILMGFLGGLSAIPGISLTGMVFSVAVARGAKLKNALDWSLMITVPALLLRMLLDLLFVVIGGTTLSFTGFLWCIAGGLFAYIGGRFSIYIVKSVIARSDRTESFYAYYVWGAAILILILYLIT